MKTIILTIGILLTSVSCSNDDDGVTSNPNNGLECYKTEYTGSTTYPFYEQTRPSSQTDEPSTNGKIVWVRHGLNGYGYKVECY